MEPGQQDPQVPKAKQAAVIAASSVDAPLKPLPNLVEVNADRLFEDGRELANSSGEESILVVHQAGDLSLNSGVIGVRDFALDPWRITPLARRVPSGKYPAEVSEAFGRAAAVRVMFNPDAEIVEWKAATTIRGKHYVPVDVGTAAVFDMAAYIDMSAQRKYEIFDKHSLVGDERPVVTLASMKSERDALIVASGHSDSGYPVYWGVDEGQNVVCLVVDFLVLATFKFDTITVPWSFEQLGESLLSPLLAARAMSVTVAHSSTDQISVTVDGAKEEVDVKLLDSNGGEPFRFTGVVRTDAQRHHNFTGHLLDLSEICLAIPSGYIN